jgi:hypothetical protein
MATWNKTRMYRPIVLAFRIKTRSDTVHCLHTPLYFEDSVLNGSTVFG